MDENKYLVVVKGEDRTVEIERYEMQDSIVSIVYGNTQREYKYSAKNVLMLKDPIVTEVTPETAVYHNDIPLSDARRALDFRTKIRVQFHRRASKVFDANQIRIETSGASTSVAKDVLGYWGVIAKYTSVKDKDIESRTFLKKQFDELKFVSPKSVLSNYLNGVPVTVEQDRHPHTTIFPFRFNLSQREALDNALGSSISVIEGPPGTGKTQTILNILANLVTVGKNVAVVSSNNSAVQNVRDKLGAEGYGFLVAALGNADNRARFFDAPPMPNTAGWQSSTDENELSRRIKDLNSNLHSLMNVERERAQLQRKLAAYQLEREHFEAYYDTQDVEKLKKLPLYRPTPQRVLEFLVDSQNPWQRGRIGSVLHAIKVMLKYGFNGLGKMKSRRADVLLAFQRRYYELMTEHLERQIENLSQKLLFGSFEKLLAQHKEISENVFRSGLHQRYDGAERIQPTASSYKRDFAKFVKQYPIILSTTHSLRNCVPENFLFDYVIVDEASQVDLISGALALSCCKRAIIVGDSKQLPQIVDMSIQDKQDVSQVRIPEPYNYFRHNLLSSILATYGDAVPKVMLREHYRCHPKIIEFCNKKYYDGQLIPFTSDGGDDAPLLLYRTVQGNHMKYVSHGRKGRFNQRELDVIEREVLPGLDSDQDHVDIGVTTPFRKQVEKATGQLSVTIETDTIHKYQGREKSTMILSTVLDQSRFGKAGLDFVNDPCMINVAVSRARHRFILVTDNSLFHNHDNEIGDLIRYMEYNTLDEHIIDSEIASVFDLLYRDYSVRLNSLKTKVKRRSHYQSENIISALLDDILQEPSHSNLEYRPQVFIKNLLRDSSRLGEHERRYVNNGSSVDFVIYHKLDKVPVLAIEVDGFMYHENNARQLQRDTMKNDIFEKYGLPLLRLATTGSGERERIKAKLEPIVSCSKSISSE